MSVPNVDDEVVLKLPEISKATNGFVSPMPTKPWPVNRMTSVNWVPDWRVEKINVPVALEKFCDKSPVMEAVVVASMRLEARKERREADEVAELRLER